MLETQPASISPVDRELNIHPELRSIKAHRLPMNRWALGMLQRLLSFVNAIHRRKYRSFITSTTLPSLDGHPVPTLIIRPASLPACAPALVYYHGGAFVMKPSPQHLENAIRYAREAACAVIFVEYRLAPKHPFPAGFDDCYAALRWVRANAVSLGIDAHRLVVGGDSAGGCLAAGVAQRAWQEEGMTLRGQLLIYPCTDLTCTRASTRSYANVPPFANLSMTGIARAYLGQGADGGMPRYASPLHGDLARLPPAYVETAQFDPLHDQGRAYAQGLIDAGVPTEVNDIDGAVHGFDLLAPRSRVAQAAMQRRIEFLRRACGSE